MYDVHVSYVDTSIFVTLWSSWGKEGAVDDFDSILILLSDMDLQNIT